MSTNSTSPPPGFAEGSWFYYAPNKVLPILFAVAFLASGLCHLYQNIKYKSWKSTGLLPIAPLVFTVGYCLREVGAFHYDQIRWYMSSTIVLLCSPPVYEAANCFVLARVLYYVPYKAPLHPFRLMITFAAFQSICDSVTSNGAAKATTPYAGDGQQHAGRILMQVSLGMQILTMACLVALALRFEYLCRRALIFPSQLRRPLRVLYASCALLSVRIVYRAVEWCDLTHADGPPNDPADPWSFPPILRTEVPFWIFEASVMLCNSLMLNVLHPTKFLPPNFKVYLARDGVTEVEGQGLGKDPRKRWQQVVDPFDFYGLFTNRDREYDIWTPEEDAKSVESGKSGESEGSEGTTVVGGSEEGAGGKVGGDPIGEEMEKQGWGRWARERDDRLVKMV